MDEQMKGDMGEGGMNRGREGGTDGDREGRNEYVSLNTYV